MARCPFATWDEINGDLGQYTGGPYKIVHHTTEGDTYVSARGAYASNKSEPHFTVEKSTIYQHIDTQCVGRSLKNPAGGVETNRDSAVQIELVGHAGRPKDREALDAVARLCRWIEAEHGVPQVWPNGLPRWSHSGGDPGGHNRDSMNWDTRAGHFGHSQVPENTHWDPGYTPAEVEIVTPGAATRDALLSQAHFFTGWLSAGTSYRTIPQPREVAFARELTEVANGAMVRLLANAHERKAKLEYRLAMSGVSVDIRVELDEIVEAGQRKVKKRHTSRTRSKG